MPSKLKPKRQFAICIRSDDPDLLTPRWIYEVLPDDSAAKSQYVRVIDNEGEELPISGGRFRVCEFSPAYPASVAAGAVSALGQSSHTAEIYPTCRLYYRDFCQIRPLEANRAAILRRGPRQGHAGNV